MLKWWARALSVKLERAREKTCFLKKANATRLPFYHQKSPKFKYLKNRWMGSSLCMEIFCALCIFPDGEKVYLLWVWRLFMVSDSDATRFLQGGSSKNTHYEGRKRPILVELGELGRTNEMWSGLSRAWNEVSSDFFHGQRPLFWWEIR